MDVGKVGAADVPTGTLPAGCALHIFTKLFGSGCSAGQAQGFELLWCFPTPTRPLTPQFAFLTPGEGLKILLIKQDGQKRNE